MSKFKSVNRVKAVGRDGADKACTMVKEISASEEGRGTWHCMGKRKTTLRKDLTHRELHHVSMQTHL